MRGRATGVALTALAVLALIGVVAVASTGSVPAGSNASRPPSDTFLDTLFTLYLVAVAAGAVLLVYGLLQRKAIAKQIALSRYPRFTVTSFAVLAVFLAVAVWLFNNWRPRSREGNGDESVFGGSRPTLPGVDQEPLSRYEPSVSWVPIAAVAGLVVIAVVAYIASSRRGRRGRDPRAELAASLADALDDALDDLRAEADPRRAIIAAYARMERVLAASGIARRPSETADEYLARVLGDLELSPHAIGRLTALFTQAKFSHHEVDSRMKETAIDALEQVRDELRSLRAQAVEPPRTQAVTS